MQIVALRVAGFIFLVMSIMQCLRLLFQVTITANGKIIPLWLSMIAAPVMLLMAIYMFIAARKD